MKVKLRLDARSLVLLYILSYTHCLHTLMKVKLRLGARSLVLL